mgnify:FL=1
MNFETIYHMFFGTDLTWYACLMRIICSFLAGAILGIERKMRQQTVGIRTLVLICVSSCLLMILSVFVSTNLAPEGKGDPARIAAQVVSGIGFLGGGAILRQGLNVKGLTSSAIIWVSAALGLAIGAGMVIPAMMTLFICVVALVYIEKLEEKYFPAELTKKLYLVFENNKVNFEDLSKVITSFGLYIINTDVTRLMGQKHISITFSVKAPPTVDVVELVNQIKQIGRLEEFRLTD